ncbi:MAG: hypothetical protein WCT01_02275 [Candidatus Shapirobacteria bacterium]
MIVSVITFILTLTYSLALPVYARAQCPVCIVTVGGGMLLAQKLGIDDLLVSIWISALNTALAFWLAPKLQNDRLKLKFLTNPLILSFLLLASTLAYFVFTSQTGGNKVLGVNKIILGQTLGFLTMVVGNLGYLKIKKQLGKTPFPYAKVAFPVGLTLIITLIFKLSFSL